MFHLWQKNFKKFSKSINYWKVRDHCHCTGKYRGVAHSICNLRFNMLYEIPVVFHLTVQIRIIIIELANEFAGQFERLGENTKKYNTFSIPVEKEVINIDEGVDESVVNISCKIKFNIVQDLWQLQYQILLTISQKKSTKVNVKIVMVFLNMKTLRIV